MRVVAPRQAKSRQLGGVAAERSTGSCRSASQPRVALERPRRQLVVDEARHRDDVPLEALGAVDGEHLHGAGLRVLRARREVFALLGLAQPGEEPAEASRVVGDREVAGERVEERLERSRRRATRRSLAADLDVEQQLVRDEGDEVGQVEPGARAQAGERARRRRAAARARPR